MHRNSLRRSRQVPLMHGFDRHSSMATSHRTPDYNILMNYMYHFFRGNVESLTCPSRDTVAPEFIEEIDASGPILAW